MMYPNRDEVADLKAKTRAEMSKKQLSSRWTNFGSGVLVGAVVTYIALYLRKS